MSKYELIIVTREVPRVARNRSQVARHVSRKNDGQDEGSYQERQQHRGKSLVVNEGKKFAVFSELAESEFHTDDVMTAPRPKRNPEIERLQTQFLNSPCSHRRSSIYKIPDKSKT